MEIEKLLIGGLVAIIGYFLRNTMNELKALEERVLANSMSVEVLKNDQSSLVKKLDEMSQDLKEIGIYIRNIKP